MTKKELWTAFENYLINFKEFLQMLPYCEDSE
jgi:hypothetical protein